MSADLVIKSNAIFDSVSDEPFSGFVAIKGNKIAAVGKNMEDAAQYIGPDTKVYDYKDKLVTAGLVDGHDHLWWGAVADSDHTVDLTASTSEAVSYTHLDVYKRQG